MNYSTAIFLINDKVRAIAVTYEADLPGKPAPQYIFKTFDESIKVGDFVVVPTNTRHNMTVCKVAEVDLEVDLESNITYSWVIGTIDQAPYQELLKMEQAAIDTIKSAEKHRKRQELRKALIADSEAKLLALPIAVINQDSDDE